MESFYLLSAKLLFFLNENLKGSKLNAWQIITRTMKSCALGLHNNVCVFLSRALRNEILRTYFEGILTKRSRDLAKIISTYLKCPVISYLVKWFREGLLFSFFHHWNIKCNIVVLRDEGSLQISAIILRRTFCILLKINGVGNGNVKGKNNSSIMLKFKWTCPK